MVVGIPVRISNFLGMNTKVIPEMIEDNELSDILNMDFDFRDSLRTRYGYRRIYQDPVSGNPVNGMYLFSKTNQQDLLIFKCGKKLYKKLSSGPVEIYTGFNSRSMATFTQFQDKLFIADGLSPLKSWDGETISNISIPDDPRPQFILTHKNRVFAAGSKDWPGYLYFSSLENPEDWRSPLSGGTGGLVRVARDNDYITGLAVLSDSVVVFTRRSIYLLYVDGDPEIDWILRKTNSDIGCVNGFTIADVDNGLYFLSERGVSVFNGQRTNVIGNALSFDNFGASEISEKIETKTRPEQNALFDFRWDKSVAAYFDNKYIICVRRNANSNNYAFVLDTRRQSWTFYDNYKFSSFTTGLSNDKTVLFAGGGNEGVVYEVRNADFAYTDDDGDPIRSHFITKAFNFAGLEITKEFRRSFISYYTGSTSGIWYSYSVDFKSFIEVLFPFRGVSSDVPRWAGTDGDATDPWGESIWAGAEDIDVLFRDIPHKPIWGRTIRFRIANYTNNTDALEDFPDEKIVPFTFFHMEHYYKLRRARNVLVRNHAY